MKRVLWLVVAVVPVAAWLATDRLLRERVAPPHRVAADHPGALPSSTGPATAPANPSDANPLDAANQALSAARRESTLPPADLPWRLLRRPRVDLIDDRH